MGNFRGFESGSKAGWVGGFEYFEAFPGIDGVEGEDGVPVDLKIVGWGWAGL